MLVLYNTDGRDYEAFIPLIEGKVGLYSCGPTVYNYAHIGNLRAFAFADILRRSLEFLGYEVSHVMNITDVGHLTDDGDDGEDKIIKESREKGMDVWEIAQFFTDAFYHDLEKLNIIRPQVVCRATEHIEDMINLIKRLEENGFTYESGGNLYFDTSKFPSYGKMALLDRQKLKAGARIEVDENKKNPHDFVLWFTNSKFERQAMVWESPWGKGYPGWHLECSAMSSKYLGEQFDIHTGGIDHIPVHHTNEIAQSEAAFGKKWVNYWLHNEFLVMENGKMSKSKGGFLTLSSLEEMGYDPLDYRYFLLGAHYRSQLIFSENGLNSAKAGRKNLIQKVAELQERYQPASGEDLGEAAINRIQEFMDHISMDLNTPKGLADLWNLIKDSDIPGDEKLNAIFRMDEILGLKLDEASFMLKEVPLDEEFLALIEERKQCREEKNFKRADEIRDYFQEKGYKLVDSPDGTKWEKLS